MSPDFGSNYKSVLQPSRHSPIIQYATILEEQNRVCKVLSATWGTVLVLVMPGPTHLDFLVNNPQIRSLVGKIAILSRKIRAMWGKENYTKALRGQKHEIFPFRFR